MTNGEHSLWLGNALKSAPEIAEQLKIANAIEIAKALYEVGGAMQKEDYIKSLEKLLKMAGFNY